MFIEILKLREYEVRWNEAMTAKVLTIRTTWDDGTTRTHLTSSQEYADNADAPDMVTAALTDINDQADALNA